MAGLVGGLGNLDEIVLGIKQIGEKLQTAASFQAAEGTSGFGIAAAVGVNHADHDVTALVGPTAVLRSSTGISVGAEISQASQAGVVGGATKKPNADGTPAANVALAVAVGVSILNNTALATVDSGATLDAKDSVSVTASVAYPFLIANPLTAINPADYMRVSGPDGWPYFNDGTLGYSSNLFNVWVMTQASQAKVAGGGSVSVTVFNNVADARIKSGAHVNQSSDPRFRDGEQAVEVKADVAMDLISVVGVGGLAISLQGGFQTRDAIKGATTTAGKALAGVQSLANPFGADGDTAGIGAGVLVQVFDNRAEAVIEQGAEVFAGTGGITVGATTDIFDFALAQAGAKASNFAIRGCVRRCRRDEPHARPRRPGRARCERRRSHRQRFGHE